jgi:MFS family permease
VALAFVISLTLFTACDGFSMVPWLELAAKVIPPTKRGSCFGFIHFLAGLGTVTAGFLISKILSDPTITFPKNYGMLILCEFIIMMASIPFLFLIKEKPDITPKEPKSLLTSLREIPQILKTNKTVRRLAFIQLLISSYSLAMPFYSIYILSRFGIAEEFLGFFLSFQMVGRLTCSFLWAHLSNKGRNKQILQYTSLMFLASSLLAVVIGTLQFPRALLELSTMLLFFLLGAAMSGVFLAFNSYIMRVAERRQRPFLLGFLNSLMVTTSILPLLGGAIIEYLPFEYVFLASLLPISLGVLLTRNLKQH